MLQSLYDGASIMHALHRQHEEISNNLANINTGGFRRAHFSIHENIGSNTRNHRGYGPEIEQRYIDFSQGRLEETRRPLDVALAGDAFFALENADGQEVYSKSGRFYREVGSEQVDDGTLLTDNGLKVLGTDGPIVIPIETPLSQISIGVDGTIVAGDNQIGQLKILAFENNESLQPISQSVFQSTNATVEKESTAEVRQNYFESANVNATSELISLIVGGRLYEAVQRATTTISDTLEQSIRT